MIQKYGYDFSEEAEITNEELSEELEKKGYDFSEEADITNEELSEELEKLALDKKDKIIKNTVGTKDLLNVSADNE